MKLYKEMIRKLAVVGLPLLAVTMVYTLVTGGQACFGLVYTQESASVLGITPILQYYVFTAVLFAMYGFSFLFSRPASDVYHSLPVRRTDLYVSVMLATATWMGATILLNVLEMFSMLLISGCPFVPVYIPLSVLFYFVASMLVLAATAVGCALSGTILTALASTGLVLLLPRFVQFLFARGVVERVPIVGWLDFGAMLDPTTNAATGILATQLRQVYVSRLVTLPHILYSLIPMAVMLAAGWWLFMRRPSEFAQRHGGYRVWTVVSAILLAFAVMMPITMNHQKLLSVYGAVLITAALAVFILYQLIASSRFRQALVTLPCFLIAVFAVLGASLLIDTAADSMLHMAPTAAEIESVTFRGFDDKSGEPSYTTLSTREVAFTDEDTKQYVSQALKSAVERAQSERNYYEYNEYRVIEPITIKLLNGGTVKRTIEFMNVNELNALRERNAAYNAGIRQYPPIGSIQYMQVDSGFTEEQTRAILESYIAESEKNNLIGVYYYRKRAQDILEGERHIERGTDQSMSGISFAGYIGDQRYFDANALRLETPETVSLLMRTYNSYIEGKPLATFNEALNLFDTGEYANDDNLNIVITTYNYPYKDGQTVEETAGFYVSQYVLKSENAYDTTQLEYMHRFVDLLSRAVLTDDPASMFIQLNWYFYSPTNPDMDKEWDQPAVFLRFENQADEQEYIDLVESWKSSYR